MVKPKPTSTKEKHIFDFNEKLNLILLQEKLIVNEGSQLYQKHTLALKKVGKKNIDKIKMEIKTDTVSKILKTERDVLQINNNQSLKSVKQPEVLETISENGNVVFPNTNDMKMKKFLSMLDDKKCDTKQEENRVCFSKMQFNGSTGLCTPYALLKGINDSIVNRKWHNLVNLLFILLHNQAIEDYKPIIMRSGEMTEVEKETM